MNRTTVAPNAAVEPIPVAACDRPELRARVRRVGRIRVPLALACRPWATLYRLPDGRLLWCLRLWDEAEGAVPRCVSTERLRAYSRANRLGTLERALDRLVRLAVTLDGTS